MAEFVFGWGTAEALRCQPGLRMCWECGCAEIVDVMGI